VPESIIQVTEGSGKKVHTWQRTIGANNVEDDFSLPGEFPLASYTVDGITALSAATSADHLLQIMAGASLNVRIRRIRVEQGALITAAALLSIGIYRLTTAGTGGGVITPQKLENGDAAAGATAMTLPTVKGVEGSLIAVRGMWPIQTAPVGGLVEIPSMEWVMHPNSKPIIIPAGIANGIAIKVITGRAGLTVFSSVEFVETSFL
jgi:hypothetical protein